ncbi:MAG: undecaprenyldiphospho-muramoylpentapeptide beta-N-acetylglucosaminyltransferase [Deltaproteobacteria bacterium]|nr:undecaprenyldiphospho-muramoylpentapeptide beta-N-acetylglucosaminyltransferase [Deltaproteobacteria bacterium]
MVFKAIIAGGGTGGHLFPAVAVGEEMRRVHPESEVLFVGASNGIEAKWFPGSGLRYELFEVSGFTGKSPLTRLRALREFLRALSRGRRLLRSFGADVVVSAGGYASAPIAVAAIIGGTPLILMEQNTRPGMANRMLWRFAHKVCVGFADAADAFDAAIVEVTGNPVRFSKTPQTVRQHTGPIQILVLGGSSGAHRLNLGVLSAVKILNENVRQFAITHQTGEADTGLVKESYRALGREARVVSFIDDIAAALDCADLIIARAGAMTVSEIALAGRPAVFVPYPFHHDNQQEHNARVLARVGGAVIVADDECLGENLAQTIRRLSTRPECLQEMGRRAHRSSIGDAAGRIVHLCFQVADQHANTPHSAAKIDETLSGKRVCHQVMRSQPRDGVCDKRTQPERVIEGVCGVRQDQEPVA